MLDFPASPTNGQLYNASNGVTYQWLSSPAIWTAQGTWTPPQTQEEVHIFVDQFGAIGDGVTDDTLAIQAAIDFAGAVPCGKVVFSARSYKITATLTVPYANVSLFGMGSDVAHTAAPQGGQAATKLTWAGADGGTMVRIHSPVGATAQALTGGGVVGIYFHCGSSSSSNANKGADVALQISSRRSGWYEDLYFEQPRVTGLLLDTVSQLGDDRGCHNNMFVTCAGRNTYSNMDGGFVKLQGDITVPPGEINSNCYFNTFMNCRPVFNVGNCYDLGNCDNNLFIRCSANCVSHSYALTPETVTLTLANPCVVTHAAHAIITGMAIQFKANSDTLPAPLVYDTPYYITVIDANSYSLSTSLVNRIAGVLIDTSAGSQAGTHKVLNYSGNGILFRASNIDGHTARNNIFTAWSGGDVIYAQGTESGLAFASHHNIFLHAEYSNATPPPTLGTGATCNVTVRSDNVQPRAKALAMSIGSPTLLSINNSLLMDNVAGRVTTESLRISNGAVDHIRFELPDGLYTTVLAEWNVGITGTGDLRWNRIIGTGNMTLIGGFRSISTGGGIGYGAGAGGTVTQVTSKSTTVALNRSSGLITTTADAIGAESIASFQFNNSAIEATDVLVLNHDFLAGGGQGFYSLDARCFAGAATITMYNRSAAPQAHSLGIRFAVIKGAVT